MKKIMEQMAEELSAAFEKAGYDPSYGKVTVSNRPDLCEYRIFANFSATVLWQEPKHITRHRL